MDESPLAVVDTNVLLHLAVPVIDGRDRAPSGADPLKTVLTVYDVHVPNTVLGEVSDTVGDDLLGTAAKLVLEATDHVTTHDVGEALEEPLSYGLDPGESRGIRLANDLGADLFVTDEFNTTNFLLVSLALTDRNTLFTTPHVLCSLAEHALLPAGYVDAALSYYVQTRYWDREYVAQLRERYLSRP